MPQTQGLQGTNLTQMYPAKEQRQKGNSMPMKDLSKNKKSSGGSQQAAGSSGGSSSNQGGSSSNQGGSSGGKDPAKKK